MTDTPSSTSPVAEVTVIALVLGVLVGLVMSVANVYLGLFVGMTVSASIPAAVISMGILRGVLRRGTILENNIVQTIASAGESLAAGIIFTIPALVITGVWTDFDFLVTTLVAITGGLLGVLFMIPLRKPMIVEDKDLIYPEGVACARVLEAGEKGGSGMKLVFGALGIAALIKLCTDAFSLLQGKLAFAFTLGGTRFYTALMAAPALIGVGYIVGINIAVLVFAGGAISWLFVGPVLIGTSYDGLSLADPELYSHVKSHLRFLGVGAMIVGGLWSIIMIRKGIVQGIRETVSSYKQSVHGDRAPARVETDMDRKSILLLLSATMLIVLWLYNHVTDNFGVSVLATGLMIVCSFFFVAVAAYIVGLVGSSNSPVSGMTICSVLITSGFIALFGYSGDLAILATLAVAGVVCCATCTSGDVCQDLKTGSLVGATPYRQQWAEVLGVVTAAFVMQPVLKLLHNGYGITTDAHLPPNLKGHVLEAPQAKLFASLMDGFFKDGQLPVGLIATGIVIGLAIIVVDQLLLKPRRSAFRLHVMPVAVGMYLPFEMSTAIVAGGLLAWLASRPAGSKAAKDAGYGRGVLLASGLIAGEAIAGVLIAIPKANEVELWEFLSPGPLMVGLTILVISGICFWLVKASLPREE
ncbi:MAG: oligopeptide transporter, OPT family [Planctomycetota bacterium]|nr:MAG: oligopeptide transporter, OPT family [Planctomycetota bacterium]